MQKLFVLPQNHFGLVLSSSQNSLDEPFYQTCYINDFPPKLYDEHQNYCGYWYDTLAQIFHARKLVSQGATLLE